MDKQIGGEIILSPNHNIGEDTMEFNIEPDIRGLLENIQLGPQARVLELIEKFNEDFVINPSGSLRRHYYLQTGGKKLGITKKFYWKPGAYDIIKEVLWYQQELHKKANSLTKVIKRSKDGSNYRLRNVTNQIESIENILIGFRQNGQIMQDNTDDVVEGWEILKNHLYSQAESGIFSMTLETVYDHDDEMIIDYHIVIKYTYTDVRVNYRHAGGFDNLAEILIPGNGHLTVVLSLSRVINAILLAKNMDINNMSQNLITNRRNNANRWYYDIGGNYESYEGIEHPYISMNRGYYGRNNDNYDFKYVCVGNIDSEIKACIKSLDFISLKVFFDRIMTHYDTNTGPLNPISKSYHGQPSFLEHADEYYNIIGIVEPSNCNYIQILQDMVEAGHNIKDDSYCDAYCTVKDRCNTYIEATKEVVPLTTEELQKQNDQQALEHATLQLVNQGRR
mgnify:FL=1